MWNNLHVNGQSSISLGSSFLEALTYMHMYNVLYCTMRATTYACACVDVGSQHFPTCMLVAGQGRSHQNWTFPSHLLMVLSYQACIFAMPSFWRYLYLPLATSTGRGKQQCFFDKVHEVLCVHVPSLPSVSARWWWSLWGDIPIPRCVLQLPTCQCDVCFILACFAPGWCPATLPRLPLFGGSALP